jgi:hypothetical protein
MRLTYSDIKSAHYRNIGKYGQETDPATLADFNASLGQRYQLILANIASYINQSPRTDTTVASSKYSTGTALCTNGDATVTGTDTVWTDAMAGSIFMITDTTVAGHHYPYKVLSRTSAVSIELTEQWRAATTVTSTYSIETPQYYAYPPGIVSLDNIAVTIGNFKYTLSPIYDQATWNQLNAMQIQPTAIPQFYFPRKDDFGIWPVPTSAYSINYNTFDRDRNLSVADYTAGTALCTNCSTSVVGTSTTWTAGMVGRWFTITDTTVSGQGYWYRVAGFTDATHITLDRPWNSATIATSTYRIGESPELPEEAHILLANGTASDYYGGLRNDQDKAAIFDNFFWTGNRSNTSRDKNDKNISAGLIGLIQNYENRDKSNLIYKLQRPRSVYWKILGSTLS